MQSGLAHPVLKQARLKRTRTTCAALCGRVPVAGLNNNNRNNASLPRAGD
jgi:hypothetical protein